MLGLGDLCALEADRRASALLVTCPACDGIPPGDDPHSCDLCWVHLTPQQVDRLIALLQQAKEVA